MPPLHLSLSLSLLAIGVDTYSAEAACVLDVAGAFDFGEASFLSFSSFSSIFSMLARVLLEIQSKYSKTNDVYYSDTDNDQRPV